MSQPHPIYRFVVEIPFAPDDGAAWQQMKNIAREGRLAEFVVEVQEVTPAAAPPAAPEPTRARRARRPG